MNGWSTGIRPTGRRTATDGWIECRFLSFYRGIWLPARQGDGGPLRGDRQPHVDSGSFAGCSVHRDLSAVATYNAQGRRQVHATAFRLGGEEGSKIRRVVCSSMPQPRSLTRRRTYVPAGSSRSFAAAAFNVFRSVVISILLGAREAWIAFRQRFITTCSICVGSATIGGKGR